MDTIHYLIIAVFFCSFFFTIISTKDSIATSKLRVLNPHGSPPPITQIPMAPRVDTLNGKMLYIIDIRFVFCESFFEELVEWFAKNMPEVKTLWKQKAGAYGEDDPQLWAEVKEKADAVILAPGH